MADVKISALPASTVPLAGTEVLPIVQSGVTKKIATDDLTVKNIRSNATTGIVQIVGPATGTTRVLTVPNADSTMIVSGGALGTPSSGTLTNCTGLPQTGLGTNVVGAGPIAIAYNTADQTFTTSVTTKMTFNTERVDSNNNFATSTFTPTVAGYYTMTTLLGLWTVSGAAATALTVFLYKNGAQFQVLNRTQTNTYVINGSCMFYANGTTDYFEIYANSDAANPYKVGGSGYNEVSFCLMRAA